MYLVHTLWTINDRERPLGNTLTPASLVAGKTPKICKLKLEGSFHAKCPHRSWKDPWGLYKGSFPVMSLTVHSIRTWPDMSTLYRLLFCSVRTLWAAVLVEYFWKFCFLPNGSDFKLHIFIWCCDSLLFRVLSFYSNLIVHTVDEGRFSPW